MEGSRTLYFNAAKLKYRLSEKNSVEAMYINNPRYDTMMPVFNKQKDKTVLNNTDENAWGLYSSFDLGSGLKLDPYYFWKHEDANRKAGMQREVTELNTIGTLAQYITGSTKLKGQLALQKGSFGSEDRTGTGGYLYAEQLFSKTKWAPAVSASYIYLSGNDTTTSSNEGWDPLFNHGPWISEIYSTYSASDPDVNAGAGYMTNLSMYKLGGSIAPLKNTKASLTYNIMKANQKGSHPGINRGQLVQAKIDRKVSDNITAFVYGEYFTPGDFHPTDDNALFVRTEILFKY
jgi:hypothetical protein